MIKIFLALLLLQVSSCQEKPDQPDEEDGIETASCIFGCLDSFSRKGVEGPTATETSETSGCNGLDLESLIGACNAYQQADTCLDKCVKSKTKDVIIKGLQYICVDRLADFKKFMPCYKEKCSAVENECSTRCGMLSTGETGWWNQLGITNNKVQSTDQKEDETTTDAATTSATVINSGDDTNQGSDPIDICRFVNCYINCSRPLVEKECGQGAYELLKVTSQILLSFVMTPIEQTSNGTLWDGSGSCEGYISHQALTARSDAVQPIFKVWSILLTPIILLIISGLQ